MLVTRNVLFYLSRDWPQDTPQQRQEFLELYNAMRIVDRLMSEPPAAGGDA
jgi:hypothetical protein